MAKLTQAVVAPAVPALAELPALAAHPTRGGLPALVAPDAPQKAEPVCAHLPDGRVWPCALRYSAKAKRYRLNVDARGFATLVMPARSSRAPAAAQKMLDSLTPWLAKTLTRLLGPDATQPTSLPSVPPELPASINIPLSGMVWHVYVIHEAGATRLQEEALDATGGRLLLHGPTDDPLFTATCSLLLQRWLRRQAARWLPPRLHLLASRMGEEVTRITVRAQRSRWGSCTSRGHISLNCLLLLIPLPLLDHVCLHELCHLEHLDHSRRFKAHLARHAPHWQSQEKALNMAWRRMPAWATWSQKNSA